MKTPITKFFRLQIEQTKTYHIYVEAESAEQARAAWEANNYEASSNIELRHRTEQGDDELVSVSETEGKDIDFDYYSTLDALGIEHPEEPWE
jgi:hypothetical protein